jgi:hypothetical protein
MLTNYNEISFFPFKWKEYFWTLYMKIGTQNKGSNVSSYIKSEIHSVIPALRVFIFAAYSTLRYFFFSFQ